MGWTDVNCDRCTLRLEQDVEVHGAATDGRVIAHEETPAKKPAKAKKPASTVKEAASTVKEPVHFHRVIDRRSSSSAPSTEQSDGDAPEPMAPADGKVKNYGGIFSGRVWCCAWCWPEIVSEYDLTLEADRIRWSETDWEKVVDRAALLAQPFHDSGSGTSGVGNIWEHLCHAPVESRHASCSGTVELRPRDDRGVALRVVNTRVRAFVFPRDLS